MCGLRSSSKPPGWDTLHADFARATPELLIRRALLSRVDTKFVIAPDRLGLVLSSLHADYAAICAPALYRSTYFDTPHLDLFHAHRCGRRLRHKVRIRHVPSRNQSFLEIKSRKNKRLTTKTRFDRPFGDESLSASDQAFVRAHCSLGADVVAQAWTEYERLTFLGFASEERVTLDAAVAYGSDRSSGSLGELVIVEVKQPSYSRHTPFMCALRAAGAKRVSPSKYCLAILSSHAAIARNRFVPVLRAIEGFQHA